MSSRPVGSHRFPPPRPHRRSGCRPRRRRPPGATARNPLRRHPSPSGAAGTVATADSGIPTGKTADGLYSKGSDSAKVVVTEYSDYQ